MTYYCILSQNVLPYYIFYIYILYTYLQFKNLWFPKPHKHNIFLWYCTMVLVFLSLCLLYWLVSLQPIFVDSLPAICLLQCSIFASCVPTSNGKLDWIATSLYIAISTIKLSSLDMSSSHNLSLMGPFFIPVMNLSLRTLIKSLPNLPDVAAFFIRSYHSFADLLVFCRIL